MSELSWLVLLGCVWWSAACGPARGGGHRWRPKKLTPLVFKQHEPNVDEKSLAASGLNELPVSKTSDKFKDLVPNYNPDIKFKDEEGTGADRLMTQRCLEKVNNLAISVMNTWPGVSLRVTEGWDEDGVHLPDSLHYEGRAVDITTSDKDRAKLGMLARLAVEAGFDWVYYESRSHIHCSVKSDSSQLLKSGGCFPGDSMVEIKGVGRKRLDEVRVGDRVATFDSDSGERSWSEVVMFLDRDPTSERRFLQVSTGSGVRLHLTPAHLVPRLVGSSLEFVFAARLAPGDLVLVERNASLTADTVVEVEGKVRRGVFAPLTTSGTLVVDGVLASCYALMESQPLAHYSFLPVRLYRLAKNAFVFTAHNILPTYIEGDGRYFPSLRGVHWYPSFLYSTASYILPRSLMYGH